MASHEENLEKQDLQVIERVSESDKDVKASPANPNADLKHRLRVNVDGRDEGEEPFKVILSLFCLLALGRHLYHHPQHRQGAPHPALPIGASTVN